MSLLFDSTVLIAHLRGVPAATEQLRLAASGDGAYASVLSRVEIEGGMRSGERSGVGRLFSGLDLVPVSDPIAGRAAGMLRRYRGFHRGIDVTDYVIAATAEEMGLDLMTLNVKRFPMIQGLRPAF